MRRSRSPHVSHVTRADDEGNGPPEFMCHMWMHERPPPIMYPMVESRVECAMDVESQRVGGSSSSSPRRHPYMTRARIGDVDGHHTHHPIRISS